MDAVNFPNEEGERAAVQHLIDQGCSSIAIVGHRFAPRAELTHAQNAFALRLRGACAALMDAGLPYNETVVFEGGCSNDGITAGPCDRGTDHGGTGRKWSFQRRYRKRKHGWGR